MIEEKAFQIKDELISIRRHLHSTPETDFEEIKTSSFIRSKLDDYGIPYTTSAKTGTVALIKGKNSNKTVLLRADIDGLPIKDESKFEIKSEREGYMHACGHDIHATCLLGAAKILNDIKDELNGNVKLVFQPAEEGVGGALPMIEDGILENPHVDAAFALHVEPLEKTGNIQVKDGSIMASPDDFKIVVHGVGGHASAPEKCVNPVTIGTAIITEFEKLNVKSLRGTQFRIWATGILKEYMQKGFALDDERLKGNGGGSYWKELLDRIRDIRSSEKVLYRQVLDLYATSIDYNPKAPESVRFFKIVQNKLHFAAHGHTAAEVIYERADAEKPFMGLKSFAGEIPALKDIGIAKNYLTETELKVLNNLVSGYFDFAEISALERRPMYMKDYINQLDTILSSSNRKLLQNSGTISHTQALEKAKQEYRKYQEKTIAPVEQAYLDTIHDLEKRGKKTNQK